MDSCGCGSGGLVGCPLQPTGAGGFSPHLLRHILNTFTFEREKKLFCGFVCQNRYRQVTDTVFENRLSVGDFAIKFWHTSFFLNCMPCMPPMRPILNYHSYSESEFVCHVCQKQIM